MFRGKVVLMLLLYGVVGQTLLCAGEINEVDYSTTINTHFLGGLHVLDGPPGTSLLARDLPSVYNGEHAKRQR